MKKKNVFMFIGTLILVCSILILVSSGFFRESRLEVRTTESPDEYELIFENAIHKAIVCCPEEIDKETDVIIMLHGYGSNASEFKSMTAFDEEAVKRNHIVVYVTGAPAKDDPLSTNGWNSSFEDSGNDDVGLLTETVSYIQSAYGLHSKKAFCLGFSNGGFMTYRLAMEAKDTFVACASVAGTMPANIWDEVDGDRTGCLLQINGTADVVVPMRDRQGDTVLNTGTPVIEDVIDYLARVNNCDNVSSESLSELSTLTRYEGKAARIWYAVILHGTHCWPDEEMAGFNVNELVLDYFEEFR